MLCTLNASMEPSLLSLFVLYAFPPSAIWFCLTLLKVGQALAHFDGTCVHAKAQNSMPQSKYVLRSPGPQVLRCLLFFLPCPLLNMDPRQTNNPGKQARNSCTSVKSKSKSKVLRRVDCGRRSNAAHSEEAMPADKQSSHALARMSKTTRFADSSPAQQDSPGPLAGGALPASNSGIPTGATAQWWMANRLAPALGGINVLLLVLALIIIGLQVRTVV